MRLPIPKFKVLLYAPGLPTAGVFASAHFEDSVLVVQGKGDWFAIQGDRVNLTTGGFNGRQWLLSWQTPSGPASAMLQGDDALQALIKLAPPVISEKLNRVHLAHGNKGRMFHAGLALLGLFFLVALGLIWFFADDLGDWATDHLSIAQKESVSSQVFEQLRPRLKLLERGEVHDTVEFIGVRVTAGSRQHFAFHVADSPRINTITLPDGNIVVTTALLRETRSAEELAAILAHQASHIEMRHALNQAIHVLGWRAVLAATVNNASGDVWQGLVRQLENLNYDEEMEREADKSAAILLRRARVSAEGLIPALERMAALESIQHATGDATPAATHPFSQERAEALRQQIVMQSPYKSRPLPVDWVRFQRALVHMPVN